MKKILYLFMVLGTATAVQAQSIESVKTMLTLQQYAKAKEEVDKGMGNAKFNAKPDAYLLKTCIYAALAMDPANKGTDNGRQLATDAEAAFKKYKEMDAAMALMADPIYQNGPINLYSFYFSAGYSDYSGKKWADGFANMKKAVELSDFLISKKLIQVPVDTNVLVLAGITAENSKHDDDAAIYYGRLADLQIPGDDFETIYRYLVNYYFGKKDMANFDKYKALGAKLYPKSDYFGYDKVDFAIGLVDDINEKIKEVEAVLAKEPDNFKANQVLGEIIYDTLHSNREGAVPPANAAELETKMVNAFKKAASLKPGSEMTYIYLGDHYINNAVKVNDARAAHAAEMKARTKPGTMASKEDIAKRDQLDKQYGDVLDMAREPYEKVAEIYAAKTQLDIREKQQYKKACNYLADIYANKKIQAKGKPADIAKYAAEEKKWNERYESIK